MAVLKCKICGGNLDITQDMKITQCPYCGVTQTLPNLNDERITNLYERANYYRRIHEFDKAMMLFESILSEDNSDPEIYWSILLCRYGIHYVEDSQTHQQIPTVHRTQYTSVYDDEDYQQVLLLADPERKPIYEAEAAKIEKIQNGILKIAKDENPFDVFICYKETDNSGNRTEDSVIAYEIYDKLTKEGVHAFFARVSLEDKLGIDYEPYIFSAINTAKVMLIVGTAKEHFEAPWVKNEWSRFLSLFNKGEDKLLIPVYKGIDVFQLPDEFVRLQALDLEKPGAMQDLVHIVCKNVNRKSEKQKPTAQKASSLMPLNKLIQNGETALKINNYQLAKQTYEQMTRLYPETYIGWWGLIVCATIGFTADIPNIAELDRWFMYAKKLYDGDDFTPFENQYCRYLEEISHSEAQNTIDRICAAKECAVEKAKNIQEQTNRQISELNKKMSRLNSGIKNAEAANKSLRKKKELAEQKMAYYHRKKWIGIGGIILGQVWFFGILFILAGFDLMSEELVGLPWLGTLITVIGIVLLARSKYYPNFLARNSEETSDYRPNTQQVVINANDEIERNTKQIKSNQTECRTLQDNIDKLLRDGKSETDVILEPVKEMDSFLALGEDTICLFHYHAHLNEIHVPFTPAENEERFTHFLYENTGKKHQGKSVVCPACSNKVTLTESEVRRGWAKCRKCGATLRFSQ